MTKKVEDLRVRSKLRRIKNVSKVMAMQHEAIQSYMPLDSCTDVVYEDDVESENLSQSNLREHVDFGTQKKLFDFELPGGPFEILPSRCGKFMLNYGRGGQVSVVDRLKMNPLCDFTTGQLIRDACFLHTPQLFALSQKKNVYIYSSRHGEEVHCVRGHGVTTHLDYLPNHFLLTLISDGGHLRYLDTSTGSTVSSIPTRMGACTSMFVSDGTGMVGTGHCSGVVSLWIPSLKEAAIKLLCHYGQITSSVLSGDFNLITAGQDMKWKVWDLRKTNYEISQKSLIGSPATSLSVSQSGQIAVGFGSRVQVWSETDTSSTSKKIKHNMSEEDKRRKPLISHSMAGRKSSIESVRFCPYEDLLLLGTSSGISSILVPGSGSSKVDSLSLTNPFLTKKQRREAEVRNVLEKLRPDMITIPSEILLAAHTRED